VIPVTLQPAYILHHRQFRDTSLIVDLLTAEHGRMSAVARGARSAKSRRRVLLQPFRPLLVGWTGRSELRTLTGVEESGMPLALTGAALGCAYYASELALRLVPIGQSNPVAFSHYVRVLTELAETDGTESAIESVLRGYELDLLDALGLLPDLAHCDVSGVRISGDVQYLFDPVACHATRAELVSIPADAVAGNTLLAMQARDFSAAIVRREAKQLMRRLLACQLGDTPLKSRDLFVPQRKGG